MRVFWGIIVMLVAFAGCLSGPAEGPQQEDLDEPSADPGAFSSVSAFGEALSVVETGGGQGIWVHEDLVYHTDGGGLGVYNISDPAAPVLLSSLPDVGARDVDVLSWQGRLYAVLAGSGKGMHVVDVSDPQAITLVDTVQMPSAGVHNLAAVPGTPYVYASGASGGRAAIDVLDLSDPLDLRVHTFDIPSSVDGVAVESDGCHDITVRVDLERAYCAGGGGRYMQGGGETFIWDITDPLEPVWLALIDDPRLVYHHQAFVNGDGTRLVINDEFIAPNCVAADLPGVPNLLDPKVPFAAAWVYDISDETAPQQMSFIQNPHAARTAETGPAANCGSHFGWPVPGMDAFVMGWYQGGTILVDYTDAQDPVLLDTFGGHGSTWDAQVHEGLVIHSSGDLVITPLLP